MKKYILLTRVRTKGKMKNTYGITNVSDKHHWWLPYINKRNKRVVKTQIPPDWEKVKLRFVLSVKNKKPKSFKVPGYKDLACEKFLVSYNLYKQIT